MIAHGSSGSDRTPRYTADKVAAAEAFAAFAAGEAPPQGPLELFLEISNVCDLKCAMCLRFSAVNPKRQSMIRSEARGFMGLEQVIAAVGELLPNVLVVHVYGYGEPTLHPGFAELLRVLARYEVLVELFTSGMHLTEELVELLVSTATHRLTLSFSGSTRKEYEQVYLGGDFRQVLGGLGLLRDRRAEAASSYPLVEVNSLAFRHHVRRLGRFVRLMAEHGVGRVNLTPLHEHSDIPALVGHCVPPGSLARARVVRRARRLADRLGIRLDIHPSLLQERDTLAQPSHSDLRPALPGPGRPRHPVRSFPKLARMLDVLPATPDPEPLPEPIDAQADSLEEVRQRLDMRRLRGLADRGADFVCLEPFKTLYVRRNGEAKACCYMADHAPALGHLGRGSADAIWQGAGFRAVREAIVNGEYPLAACAYCLLTQQAPPSHGIDRRLVDYASWVAERFGASPYPDRLRQVAADLAGLGDGRAIVARLVAGGFPLVLDRELAAAAERELAVLDQCTHLGEGHRDDFEGYLDSPDRGQIAGWVWSPRRPELRLPVKLTIDGQPFARAVAYGFRPDLLEAGKGDGRYGFSFALDQLPRGATRLRVFLGDTRCQLRGSPRRVQS